MLDEKTQESMLSPKGFNKFQSDGGFANCCGKQPTELANEIQKILDELEKLLFTPGCRSWFRSKAARRKRRVMCPRKIHNRTEKTQIWRKENDLPLPPPLRQTPFRRTTCINHAMSVLYQVSRIFLQAGNLVWAAAWSWSEFMDELSISIHFKVCIAITYCNSWFSGFGMSCHGSSI